MADTFASFDNRLRKIDSKHRKIALGYTTRVGDDGLIVIRPRRRGIRVPLKGLALLVLGFFGLKGLMLAQIGIQGYSERVGTLQQGSIVENLGAWIMQADAFTIWVAQQVAPLIH